jgi:alanine dehydrogenase
VVIIGAGNAGGNAAELAAAIGARVVVFDVRDERLSAMSALGDNVRALRSDPDIMAKEIRGAVSKPRVRRPGKIQLILKKR